jgi:uncharacterized iron-regulated membrane protein
MVTAWTFLFIVNALLAGLNAHDGKAGFALAHSLLCAFCLTWIVMIVTGGAV